MSKKLMTPAVIALVVVALAGTALTTTACNNSRQPVSGSSAAQNGGTSTSSTAAATGTAGSTGTTLTEGSTNGVSKGGVVGKKAGNSGVNPGQQTGSLTPYPKLPDPGLPAQVVNSPFPAGQKLPPLSTMPRGVQPIAEVAPGTDGLYSRAEYTIVMEPYGLGPDSVWGSGLVVKIDSIAPVGRSPKYTAILGKDVLVIPDTTSGGTVTLGGKYKALLTWRSNGTLLLPIMSAAQLQK